MTEEQKVAYRLEALKWAGSLAATDASIEEIVNIAKIIEHYLNTGDLLGDKN